MTLGRALLLALAFSAPCVAAAGFNLTDTSGKSHRLTEYQGKWVLVNFWATWCPPCVEEIPELSALHDEREDFMVLGVAMDYEDPKEVRRFAAEQKMSYPLVLGNERLAAQVGKVKLLPANYLYDPRGKLVLHRIGPITRAQIEGIIETSKSGATPEARKN